jgi:hypothetical protein
MRPKYQKLTSLHVYKEENCETSRKYIKSDISVRKETWRLEDGNQPHMRSLHVREPFLKLPDRKQP